MINVCGTEDAAALPGVQTCEALVAVGATVPPLRSSWDRTVVSTALGPSATAARDTAERATRLVRIDTKPV